jgi:hypothetical protein
VPFAGKFTALKIITLAEDQIVMHEMADGNGFYCWIGRNCPLRSEPRNPGPICFLALFGIVLAEINFPPSLRISAITSPCGTMKTECRDFVSHPSSITKKKPLSN